MTSSSNGNPDTGPDPVPDADAASKAGEFDSSVARPPGLHGGLVEDRHRRPP